MLMHRAPLLAWLAEHDPLAVVSLDDHLIESLGHDPRSAYAETFWVAVLGPSSVMLLRRLAGWLEDSPGGFPLALRPAAAEIGLGHSGGINSPMTRTLGRLVTFEMAAIRGETLAVRRMLPPLARRHLARLPGHLAERHRDEHEAHALPGETSGAIHGDVVALHR